METFFSNKTETVLSRIMDEEYSEEVERDEKYFAPNKDIIRHKTEKKRYGYEKTFLEVTQFHSMAFYL